LLFLYALSRFQQEADGELRYSDIDNGLCLCSLHHKLFDKGVLGVGWGPAHGVLSPS
jgi:predicted restriction endonuclease